MSSLTLDLFRKDYFKIKMKLLIVFFLTTFSTICQGYEREMQAVLEDADKYRSEWIVKVEGGPSVAQPLALELGYVYGGNVYDFPDIFVFRRGEQSSEKRSPSFHHTRNLVRDCRVSWAEQVYEKKRVKRWPMFNDVLWSKQSYLDKSKYRRNIANIGLNVFPVYAMGFNGSGVRVCVVDDGLEHTHDDLRDNYDPEISWDVNDDDADPYPSEGNAHGTRCAGEIAMKANNLKGGVGVAWGAKVGGVRMLGGRVTDLVEGIALGYAWDKVDIYSMSWGPTDDGQTVDGMGRLATDAVLRGIKEGRRGKGTIYVWANGNGGKFGDNCNCDGYSSSIYTISIASASLQGLFPWYGELCSSTFATAYSPQYRNDQQIVTTDLENIWTLEHSGTSAAAPLATGIIALVLEANPDLTWRDVQHLIALTSNYEALVHNDGWHTNACGYHYNVRFGFGLLDAAALVDRALTWTTVPEKTLCRFHTTSHERISSTQPVKLLLQAYDCILQFVEHVEVVVDVSYSRRGALEIDLTSPQGTTVQILSQRPNDLSKRGFKKWSLISLATWGEPSEGVWTVTVYDHTNEDNYGEVGPCQLVIHGMREL